MEFLETVAANIFAVKTDDTVGATAKDAGRLIFFEHDAALVDKDLERILFIDIEGPAEFDRQNNAAEFIDFADNTGRFQSDFLPKISDY